MSLHHDAERAQLLFFGLQLKRRVELADRLDAELFLLEGAHHLSAQVTVVLLLQPKEQRVQFVNRKLLEHNLLLDKAPLPRPFHGFYFVLFLIFRFFP